MSLKINSELLRARSVTGSSQYKDDSRPNNPYALSLNTPIAEMPGVDTVRLGQFELSLSTIEDLEKLFIILSVRLPRITVFSR